MREFFTKTIVFCTLVVCTSPAKACFSDKSGSIDAWSNRNDVSIGFEGTSIPTSEYPNSWEIIEGNNGDGSVFKFVINTDKTETTWNGLRLAFHTEQSVADWSDGEAVTFRPYSSLASRIGATSYPAFSCGNSAGGEVQLLPGYFGGDFVDQDPSLPRRQAIWYIDSQRSTATLEMSRNTIAANGKFLLSGVLDLVYVNEMPNSSAGSALDNAGVSRSVQIVFEDFEFQVSR